MAVRNAPGIATALGPATTTVGCVSAQRGGRASTARRCRSGHALTGGTDTGWCDKLDNDTHTAWI